MSGMHRNRVNRTQKEKKHDRFRLFFQLAAAALFNGYAAGYFHGKIFTGKSKMVCVPVLNCYSCPGALGACPIGSMQSVAGGAKHNISFYVLGTLMLFGLLLGRLVCGFLCPAGTLGGGIPLTLMDSRLRSLTGVIFNWKVFVLVLVIVGSVFISRFFSRYLCPLGICIYCIGRSRKVNFVKDWAILHEESPFLQLNEP